MEQTSSLQDPTGILWVLARFAASSSRCGSPCEEVQVGAWEKWEQCNTDELDQKWPESRTNKRNCTRYRWQVVRERAAVSSKSSDKSFKKWLPLTPEGPVARFWCLTLELLILSRSRHSSKDYRNFVISKVLNSLEMSRVHVQYMYSTCTVHVPWSYETSCLGVQPCVTWSSLSSSSRPEVDECLGSKSPEKFAWL